MAAHNAEQYLHRSIQSIIDQTFDDFELIVINDGSYDDTQEIAERFAELDRRVHVHTQRNLGLTQSLNRGLALCRAQLVARMDADDVSYPTRLEAQTRFMSRHPDISALGCHVRMINAIGKPIRNWRTPSRPHEAAWRLSLGCTLPHPGVMFRKCQVEQLGGYDPERPSAQDYDLWCRMTRAGHRITNLPECLLDYRVHSLQISARHAERQQLTADKISIEHLRWILCFEPDPQAASDFRRLCSIGFTRCELDTNRIDLMTDLIIHFTIAIRRLYSQEAYGQALRYTTRKLIKAAFLLGLQRDPCASYLLAAAQNLRRSRVKQNR